MSDTFPIIFHDHELIAVAKPSGIPVIPARDEPVDDCLHHRVEVELGERLWVVHRIDRDTSGIVLFARNAEAHRRLSMAFEQHTISKLYLAFVAGRPEPTEGRIETPLHEARKGKMRPAKPGEPDAIEAVTVYRVRRSWRRDDQVVSLVEAAPLTGRQHQIRVHLRSAGAPVLGDALYGRATFGKTLEDLGSPRLALHAFRLELPGADGKLIAITAPVPPDLVALQERLDSQWSVDAGETR